MNEKNLSLQLPIANNDTALYTKKITPLCTLLVKGNFMSMRLFYSHLLSRNLGFPGGSVVKNPSANPGDTGSIPGSGGSPVGGHGNPPAFLPGKPNKERNMAGYSPWGCKESNTT